MVSKLFPEIELSQNFVALQNLIRCITCENFNTTGLLDQKFRKQVCKLLTPQYRLNPQNKEFSVIQEQEP